MVPSKSLMQAGLAVAIAVGACTGIGAQQQGPANLPADVTGFIIHRTACSERVAQMDAATEGVRETLQSMNCFDIVDDERTLRQKYAGHPEILASLGAGTWTKVVKRLPYKLVVPPDFDQ